VLVYTIDCLAAAVQNEKSFHSFYATPDDCEHNEIILVFPYLNWEQYAKRIVTLFDRGIYQFYSSVDARNGFCFTFRNWREGDKISTNGDVGGYRNNSLPNIWNL